MYAGVMVEKTVTDDSFGDLLQRVRSRRALPAPEERRAIREAAGCSLREIGDAIGVSFMAVRRWEQGSRPRNPRHLAAYSRLLDELKD
jgi:DNA-binding transcriptional regulator YiaG